MKSTVWTLILLGLVFAIGWTSRVVAERSEASTSITAEEASSESRPGHRDGHRGSRGGRGGRGIGRFLDSVRQFSAELELTDEQESSLSALFEETLAQVQEHEKRAWQVTHDARPKLRAILTDTQRDRLDELVGAKFAERSAEKVQSTLEWATMEFALEPTEVERLGAILHGHEERKRALFESSKSTESADRTEFETQMGDLREELSAELSGLLDEEQREHFLSRSGSRRWGKGRDLVE